MSQKIAAVKPRYFIYAGAAIAILAALAWLPTPHRYTVTEGTDAYRAHRPLFESRTTSHPVTLPANATALGTILVPLYHDQPLTPVTVRLHDGDTTLLETVIPPERMADDTFAWADISDLPPQSQSLTLTLAAPHATSQNPVGVRLNIDHDPPQLALALTTSVPAWQQLPLWQARHPEAANRLVNVVLGAGPVTLLLAVSRTASASRRRLLIVLLLLAAAAIVIRIPPLLKVDTVFGGDAFNYQLKAIAWVTGEDPFTADPRKGPVYSFLLIPGLLTPDPLLWAKAVSIAAAASTVVLVVLILQKLKLPLPYALTGGLLLAVNRQFWWESVHGLANILYAALIMAAVLAFLHHKKRWGPYVVGALGALITLTRYEGALAPAILVPWLWLEHRFKWRTVRDTLLPLVIIGAIPFLLWPFSGTSGVRSLSDLQSDDGLSIAWSYEDAHNNYQEWRRIAARSWIFTGAVGAQYRWLITGVVVGLVGTILVQRQPRFQRAVVITGPLAITAAILILLVRDTGFVQEHLANVIGFTMGLGLGNALYRWPRVVIPLALVVAAQIAAITLILPKERYYVHLMPFFALTIPLGIYALTSWPARLRWQLPGLAALALITSLVYWDSARIMPDLADEYNGKAREMSVVLQAARYLRDRPGAVAANAGYLPLRVYLGDARLEIFSPEDASDVRQWLRDHDITYVIEVSTQTLFVERWRDSGPTILPHQTFVASSGQNYATVYQLDTE